MFVFVVNAEGLAAEANLILSLSPGFSFTGSHLVRICCGLCSSGC